MALRWLELLTARRQHDAELLSRLGYVQLCIGDLQAAAATFVKVCFCALPWFPLLFTPMVHPHGASWREDSPMIRALLLWCEGCDKHMMCE